MPLDPTQRLSAELEAQQWNQVLALLGEGPYRIAQPIILALQQQLGAAAAQIEAIQPHPPGNGLDHPTPPARGKRAAPPADKEIIDG